MSGSVNKVILVGNLTHDVEVRHLPSGGKVVNMTVATNESWRDKNSGERKEKSEFHRVVIFNEGIAKIAEQYLRKGSKVYLEGQLQTRKWQDQSGADKYSTEVVLQSFNSSLTLLDSRSDDSQPRQQQSQPARHMAAGPSGSGWDDGSEIPFMMEWR